MSDALCVQSLGKCYPTYRNNLARFAHWFGLAAGPPDGFWAVRDLNFTLGAGESIAIIGTNGAGKSTLLKLIAGTVRPTSGKVQVAGRVAAILELGLGFNQEFTGRQNAGLAGGLMGMSGATLQRVMPEIEAFAELGEFFDQPLRVYSTGMQARLAFAVATAVRPEILIVDEVLSVGDSYFQHKSFDRIRRFSEQGTSLLLVTHALSDVRVLCDRVMLLDKGGILKVGMPDEVIDYYNALVAVRENAKLSIEQRRSVGGWTCTRSGTGEARLDKVTLLDAASGADLQTVLVGQPVRLECDVALASDLPRLVLGVLIRSREGLTVWGTNTWRTRQVIESLRQGDRVVFNVAFACSLGPGSYSISVALVSSDSNLVDNFDWIDNLLVFDVINADKPFFIGTNCIDAAISHRIEPCQAA